MSMRYLLITLALGVGLLAQVNKSNLTGTVRDSSGAAVPGASMLLVNTGTGLVRQQNTEATGLYRFSLLDFGTYRLEAEASGFKKFIRDAIQLETGETSTVSVTLEIGAMTESVTVTTEGPLLRTETGSLGTTIGMQAINELPALTRNPYAFLELSPGVQYYGAPASKNPWDTYGLSDFAAGGSEGRSEFLLDGVPNMRLDIVSFSPSPDAVQEIRAHTNTYDAEYGHSSAAFVNVSTKSGSNEVHGSVYWYLRNDDLNANSFFNNRLGQAKSENKQITYGASLGGPVYPPAFTTAATARTSS